MYQYVFSQMYFVNNFLANSNCVTHRQRVFEIPAIKKKERKLVAICSTVGGMHKSPPFLDET